MVPDPPLGTLREHLDQTLDCLALPGADLVRMDLVLRGDLLQRPRAPISCSVRSPRSASSATFAFSSSENLRRLLLICICMDASRMARTDVRVMGQADCSFVFGLFLQELSLLALMESADPRLISSVGSWP